MRAGMMQQRLTSLALHIHYKKVINLEEVVDIFSTTHPRKMMLNEHSTGKLHQTGTCNLQSMEDVPCKKPPKPFIFLAAAILLTVFIGLFIFIFMPSEQSQLQTNQAHLLKTGTCLETWRKRGDRCFLLVSDRKNWTDAEAYCVAKGAHLASVDNQTMYDFLKRLAHEYFIWVGGYKENDEWKWTDGSKFEVKKYEEKSEKDAGWAWNEPDNEDCMVIQDYDRGLGDESCDLKQPFICQY
ncbi:C-type lectin domain family 2 member D-like [Dunckerocampus dactyliophorus]|uniref:C-type lectin domain family 2 member D-like n=1 Tax=Dunckerocampus dactyliophorus TaxID=161453 RepID=UPI002406AF09|nr:C-type lectin domain family 2 member D-like [Dunckerocampus dactyliophorus]